eukprot:g3670.t1
MNVCKPQEISQACDKFSKVARFADIPPTERKTQSKKMSTHKEFHVARRRSRYVRPYPNRRPSYSKKPLREAFSSWECLELSEKNAFLSSFGDPSPPAAQHKSCLDSFAKLRALDPCLASPPSQTTSVVQRSRPPPSFCRTLKDLPLSRCSRSRSSHHPVLGSMKSHPRHLSPAAEDLREVEDEYDDLSDDYGLSDEDEEWVQSEDSPCKDSPSATFVDNDVDLSDMPDEGDDTEFSVADEMSICCDSSGSSSSDSSICFLARISSLHLSMPAVPQRSADFGFAPLTESPVLLKEQSFSVAFPSNDESDFVVAMEQ